MFLLLVHNTNVYIHTYIQATLINVASFTWLWCFMCFIHYSFSFCWESRDMCLCACVQHVCILQILSLRCAENKLQQLIQEYHQQRHHQQQHIMSTNTSSPTCATQQIFKCHITVDYWSGQICKIHVQIHVYLAVKIQMFVRT